MEEKESHAWKKKKEESILSGRERVSHLEEKKECPKWKRKEPHIWKKEEENKQLASKSKEKEYCIENKTSGVLSLFLVKVESLGNKRVAR